MKTVKIGSTCKEIPSNIFQGCTALTNIKTGDTDNTLVSSVTKIGDKAFSGCTSLQKITINSSPTMGAGVFHNCHPNFTVITTKAITYTVTQKGIYQITLYGARGGKMTSMRVNSENEGEAYKDNNVAGKRGAKVSGYIKLEEGKKLNTIRYNGGTGTKSTQVGSDKIYLQSGNGRSRYWYKAK